jgi:hypothetical protein
MKSPVVTVLEDASKRTMQAVESKAGPAISGMYKDTGTRTRGVVHTVQTTDSQAQHSFDSITSDRSVSEARSASDTDQAMAEASRKADVTHILAPASDEAAKATSEYRKASLAAAKKPNASVNRPLVNAGNPNKEWVADNFQPGRADGRVLSGHGGWDNGQYIQVPKGTRVHFYTQHGQVVPDGLGGDIETGAAHGRSVEQGNTPGAARIFTGGRSIPNYTISEPTGLTIKGSPVVATPHPGGGYNVQMTPGAGNNMVHVNDMNDPALNGHSVTFSQDMNLHELLQENMGDVHFAACRYVETPYDKTRNQDEGLFNP